MSLKCSACGAPFRAGDLDPDLGVATCRYCNAITRLSVAEPAAPPPPAAAPPPAGAAHGPAPLRPRVPRPSAVKVEDWGDRLQIRVRWFTPTLFFLLFFCIAWDGFLVFWYSAAIFGAGSAPGAFAWIMIIFPVAHVAVGVGLTYTVLAGFLNTTRIEVTGSELSVRHGPIPWRGNRRLATADIEQLYCDRQSGGTGDQHAAATHRLHAVMRDGTKVQLLSLAGEPDRVRFIEQAIEDHLRLPHRPVAGELA